MNEWKEDIKRNPCKLQNIDIRNSQQGKIIKKNLEYADCIPQNRCPENCDAQVLEIWREWSTPSLSLLPGSLRSRVVLPVRVPSMSERDPFKNYSYLIGPSAKQKATTQKTITQKT